MYFREPTEAKPLRIRDNPMHRSSSVSAIIHGDPSVKSNHYVDALERFKRDHATIDRQQRDHKRQMKMQNDEKRRHYAIERQNKIKKNQDENLSRLLERQHHSQMLHAIGAKQTAHTPGIPVNPINLKYDENPRGDRQAFYDQQRQINRLIRAHNLQTQGTSGYNLINGRSSLHLEDLIPRETHAQFEQKLSNFYSRYRLDPNEGIKK